MARALFEPDLHFVPRAFRPMLGVRRDERHSILTQSRAQAIEEWNRRDCVVAGEKSKIAASQRSDRLARERDRLDGRGQHDAR